MLCFSTYLSVVFSSRTYTTNVFGVGFCADLLADVSSETMGRKPKTNLALNYSFLFGLKIFDILHIFDSGGKQIQLKMYHLVRIRQQVCLLHRYWKNSFSSKKPKLSTYMTNLLFSRYLRQIGCNLLMEVFPLSQPTKWLYRTFG